MVDGKILVAYFSAGGVTAGAAKEIAALYGVNKNLLYKSSLNLNAKK